MSLQKLHALSALLLGCALALVGDLRYDVQLLDRGQVPGVGNRRLLRRSTLMLNQLRGANPALVVLATHELDAAAALAQAEVARAAP
jgi:N-acyl homoserine lactone hydrolase